MSLIVTEWSFASFIGSFDRMSAHSIALSAAGYECKGISSTLNGKVYIDGDMAGDQVVEYIAFFQRPVRWVSDPSLDGRDFVYNDYVAPQ